MDENNNGVNYGPDPINNGGAQYGNPNPINNGGAQYSNPDPINNGGQQYVNPNQQPPVYNTVNPDLDPGKGMATGALVCGIIGLCCCGFLSIVAIVLGAIARGKCTTDSNRKKATAGLVLGIIGVVLAVIATILNILTGAFNNITSSSSSSYYYGY